MSNQTTQPNQTIQNLFINGEWVVGEGATLTSTNPATNDIVWQANSASERDVEKAFQAAHDAFQAWALTPLAHRIAVMEKYKALLEANKEQLAKDIMNDMGKPWRSLGLIIFQGICRTDTLSPR